MTLISNELKSIEISLRELIEIIEKYGIEKIGNIRLASDIVENGKVYTVKGSDLSNPAVQKKFIDKGVEYVNIEITPKVVENIIEKHPERYSDKNLDANVQTLPKEELRNHSYIRENVADERGKIIVKKWTQLKSDHINLIKKFGTKNEYEVYESTETGSAEDIERLEENSKPNILIIDDQVYVTDSLKMALEDYNFNVTAINDNTDIISKIRNSPPDIILLDINMPVMNGFELLEQMKLFGTLRNIPVIMITARNVKSDILKAINLGASDYIVKPFNYKNIIKKIAKYLPENKKNIDFNEIDVNIKDKPKDENLTEKLNDLLGKI
ncbi:MAG TPA: response regulator [bacterium]|nr:response regulator [bacterium]HPN30212.1 response regulator [bacterium]